MKIKRTGFFLAVAFLLLMQAAFAETFNHAIRLQLADGNGAPVENTQFWVTVQIVKKKNQITLNFPTINIQVGQCASNNPECMDTNPGYIITTAGFLPPELRSNTLVPISVNAAAGDGIAPISTSGMPPVPPSGFFVMVDNSGGVVIQQAGASQNALSVGAHIILPCSITYVTGKKENICFNFQLSEGQIDVTQFTGHAGRDNVRDSHLNDAFDNTFAWAWTDNHNIDPKANTVNAFVLVGKIDKKGRLKLGNPIQLTDFPRDVIAWDTSVAINRQDKNNIVVSYGIIREAIPELRSCRAVSFDGGKTWGGVFDGVNSSPTNGRINVQQFDSGDLPGVRADKYGNFWYGVTDLANSNIPHLLISVDKGVTWTQLPDIFPTVVSPEMYDYPHLVFGGDGSGQYGIWYYADYFNSGGDIFPAVAFIPINGLGNFGSPVFTFLDTLRNRIELPTVEASNDGRFWALGYSGFSNFQYSLPIVTIFKSPGLIDQNYAGPWVTGSQNQLNLASTDVYQFNSIPEFAGYFISVEGLLYDEKRQALYALFSAQYPPLSQNMRLYFSISRNNGQTWSSPFDISATAFANRGFDSMSLDPSSGNIYIGWYDGRNDPSQKKIQYFGGIIPAQLLDQLVKQIPLSDPLYHIPMQGTPIPPP